MTDKKEKFNANGLAKYLDIVVAVFVLVGLFLGLAVFLSGSGGETTYGVSCSEYDVPVETGWLLSDNITSYEDIPQNQKRNLSNDTVETLKRLNSYSYNATDYTDMSNKQKRVFIQALNGSIVVRNRSKTPDTQVVYKNEIYFCDTDIQEEA